MRRIFSLPGFGALLMPLALSVSLSLLSSTSATAMTVGNVQMPDNLSVKGADLVLNGAGMRNKYFVDVYVAGIYLPETSKDGQSIVSANEIQAVRLVVVSSLITRDRILEPIQEAVSKSAGADYPRYAPLIRQLYDSFNIEVKPGDTIDFVWVPGSGTHVSLNGNQLHVLPDYDLKKILFGLWIGPNAVQDSLRQQMLGLAE